VAAGFWAAGPPDDALSSWAASLEVAGAGAGDEPVVPGFEPRPEPVVEVVVVPDEAVAW
jgi:hypothetical protein